MVLSRCRQLRYAVFSPEWLKRAYTTAGNDLDRGFQSYISSSNDPFLNLSIEHHLLQKASKTSTVLLLYVNRPCVVIGRNQNPWTEVNLSLLSPGRPGSTAALSALGPIDLVRRRSGGGTVFHDAGNVNWTVISPSDSFTRDKHAEMVVRALRRSGIARSRVNERHDIVLDLNGETGSPNAPKWGSEDDTHRTPWQGQPDIRTVKVSGSAYKLTRGRALHHGTALLNSPNLAALRAVLSAPGKPFIESKGVASVSSPVANIGLDNDEFTGVVQAEFAKMYHCDSLAPAVVDETWLEDSEVAKGYEELKVSTIQIYAYDDNADFMLESRLDLSPNPKVLGQLQR